MTEAPYPADTRAKGWRFELDHERIRQSDTWALAPADVRPWLLMLWMVAWEQTPCGSMPDDDGLIAARIGINPKAFAKVRPALMRGWWKAADGRLYHRVITERVADMLEYRRKEADRKGRHRGRTRDSGVSPTDVPRDTIVTDGTGTGTSNTVPNGTGDTPDPIFGIGLDYIVSTGVDAKSARSFLGKLRKVLGDDLIAAELVVKARQLEVSDPIPWLRAAAQKRLTSGRTSAGVAL
jgi:hypothetical protein